MSRCKVCKGKGFIESTYAKNATFYPSLKRCPVPGCPHEKGFHKEVADRFSKGSQDKPDHQTSVHESGGSNIPERPLVPENSNNIEQDAKEHYLNGTKEVAKEINQQVKDNMITNFQIKCPTCNPTDEEVKQTIEEIDKITKPMPVVDYVPTTIKLPEGFKEAFKNLDEQNEGKAVLIMSTNIGKVIVGSVEEAESIIKIVDKYVQHGELLDWLEQFDNVEVFPLPRRLGIK